MGKVGGPQQLFDCAAHRTGHATKGFAQPHCQADSAAARECAVLGVKTIAADAALAAERATARQKSQHATAAAAGDYLGAMAAPVRGYLTAAAVAERDRGFYAALHSMDGYVPPEYLVENKRGNEARKWREPGVPWCSPWSPLQRR